MSEILSNTHPGLVSNPMYVQLQLIYDSSDNQKRSVAVIIPNADELPRQGTADNIRDCAQHSSTILR